MKIELTSMNKMRNNLRNKIHKINVIDLLFFIMCNVKLVFKFLLWIWNKEFSSSSIWNAYFPQCWSTSWRVEHKSVQPSS